MLKDAVSHIEEISVKRKGSSFVQKYSMSLSCNDSCPSQLQSLAEDLQLAGVEGQMDGKLCSSGEGGTNVMISLYIHVCVAPPMIVGVWSMAVVLW